jgi:hypothetical protein
MARTGTAAARAAVTPPLAAGRAVTTGRAGATGRVVTSGVASAETSEAEATGVATMRATGLGPGGTAARDAGQAHPGPSGAGIPPTRAGGVDGRGRIGPVGGTSVPAGQGRTGRVTAGPARRNGAAAAATAADSGPGTAATVATSAGAPMTGARTSGGVQAGRPGGEVPGTTAGVATAARSAPAPAGATTATRPLPAEVSTEAATIAGVTAGAADRPVTAQQRPRGGRVRVAGGPRSGGTPEETGPRGSDTATAPAAGRSAVHERATTARPAGAMPADVRPTGRAAPRRR